MEAYDNWLEEKKSAYLYSIMAQYEKNNLHKKLFLDLHDAAEKQASIWEKKLTNINLVFTPDTRTRFVVWLIKLVGIERLHNVLSAMKIRGMSVFNQFHSEHKHTSFNATSNLRAAVFGVNDGLISNLGLILGVAGANANQHFIFIAGIAGLLAGAFSMAAGEYISVRSQREVFEYQIAIERKELEEYPEEEIQELNLIYQARGVPPEDAYNIAKLMINNPETGLNTLAREELGLNPEELVSPMGAMFSSFISFALGAAIPLIPFMISLNLKWLLISSITLSLCALFGIGAFLSLFTNRNPFYLGLRMLTIGLVAGGLTFLIGKYLDVLL